MTQEGIPVRVDPGVEHRVFTIPEGESAKTLATIEGLCRDFAQWGLSRADIVVGEGQPLGSPVTGGGPLYGIFACTKPYLRLMPGRIAGRSIDVDGKEAYCLTLSTREQHIRRHRATSNICTNETLIALMGRHAHGPPRTRWSSGFGTSQHDGVPKSQRGLVPNSRGSIGTFVGSFQRIRH